MDILIVSNLSLFFLQFKVTIKSWEDKHKELNEQIKLYQKSQKELEDSVVLKDHNVEVGIFSHCFISVLNLCQNVNSRLTETSPGRCCLNFWQT